MFAIRGKKFTVSKLNPAPYYFECVTCIKIFQAWGDENRSSVETDSWFNSFVILDHHCLINPEQTRGRGRKSMSSKMFQSNKTIMSHMQFYIYQTWTRKLESITTY